MFACFVFNLEEVFKVLNIRIFENRFIKKWVLNLKYHSVIFSDEWKFICIESKIGEANIYQYIIYFTAQHKSSYVVKNREAENLLVIQDDLIALNIPRILSYLKHFFVFMENKKMLCGLENNRINIDRQYYLV